jgi:nucleotide-binding universal stress UspA family protein
MKQIQHSFLRLECNRAVASQNCASSFISLFGDPVEEILSTAVSTKADWIVLGVDGDLPLLRLKDTTAYKVLAATNCPVVTLRHETHRVEQTTEIGACCAGVIG